MKADESGISKRPFIAGISGGSAAGKTMVANMLAEIMGDLRPLVVGVDRYFRDRSSLSSEDRVKINYDVPEALDFETLAADIEKLRNGKDTSLPVYDYATHSARPSAEDVQPAPLVIVEGILLFYPDEMKPLLDFRLFVEAERDVRLQRRIARDVVERGRSRESVILQFNETVEPGFEKYTKPTRAEADFILDWNVKDMASLGRAAELIRLRMV